MRSSLVLIVFVAACGAGDPAPGGERALCRADATCDVGLECWSDVCVRPPAADCGAVAARLAAVRLGNYATDDERRPMLADLRAQCQRERLTAREGQCLVAAPDEDALAECPRALLPELDGTRRRCAPIADRVVVLFAQGGALANALGPTGGAEAGELLAAACVDDAWGKAITGCIRDAGTLDGVRACADGLPPAARRRLDRKLERLAARTTRTRVPPPDPWAARPTATLTGPCARYVELLEAYASCSQLPATARDSIRQSIDALKTSWGATPPAARDAVDSACRQGADAMVQGMRSLGC